jgi:hypothetical protein
MGLLASPAAILALIKLLTDLTPLGISAVKALIDRMKGMTDEQIAQLTHALNATAISEIDTEIAKLPPPKP